MFTGLVETMGEVFDAKRIADGAELSIVGSFNAQCAIGESVAVNGACLTVVEISKKSPDLFRVQLGFETLEKTNLGELRPHDRVNLERSLCFGNRVGGHLVTGHIDAVGRIAERTNRGEFESIWFSCPPELTRQMVSKGSIAIDGISLTLVDVTADGFSVMLIPHTLQMTTLGFKKVGETVNLETDLLAKYVQKQLQTTHP
jgi:riboflavin synthase